MVRDIDVVVTLQVDDDDYPLSESEANTAAVDATHDAMKLVGERFGYQHAYANTGVCIGFVGVKLAPQKAECDICGGEFDADDLHSAMSIDGQSDDQPMGLVKVCDHCYETEVNAPGWGWSNDYNDPDEYVLLPNGEWTYKEREELTMWCKVDENEDIIPGTCVCHEHYTKEMGPDLKRAYHFGDVEQTCTVCGRKGY